MPNITQKAAEMLALLGIASDRGDELISAKSTEEGVAELEELVDFGMAQKFGPVSGGAILYSLTTKGHAVYEAARDLKELLG